MTSTAVLSAEELWSRYLQLANILQRFGKAVLVKPSIWISGHVKGLTNLFSELVARLPLLYSDFEFVYAPYYEPEWGVEVPYPIFVLPGNLEFQFVMPAYEKKYTIYLSDITCHNLLKSFDEESPLRNVLLKYFSERELPPRLAVGIVFEKPPVIRIYSVSARHPEELCIWTSYISRELYLDRSRGKEIAQDVLSLIPLGLRSLVGKLLLRDMEERGLTEQAKLLKDILQV